MKQFGLEGVLKIIFERFLLCISFTFFLDGKITIEDRL